MPWPAEPPLKSAKSYIEVDPARLPPRMIGVAHPDWFGSDETWAWTDWIIRGQLGELPRSQVFQFKQVADAREDISYREVPHSDSQLRYGPESRLFVARLLATNNNDPLGRAELEFHVRKLEGEPSYRMFAPADLKELRKRISGSPELISLLSVALQYEELQPVKVSDVAHRRITSNR